MRSRLLFPVDQLRYLILGYSLQLYYMRWPVLFRPIRTADGFSDSIRIVGYSEEAAFPPVGNEKSGSVADT